MGLKEGGEVLITAESITENQRSEDVVPPINYKEAKEKMIDYFKKRGKAWISDAAIDLNLPFDIAFKIARELEEEKILG